MHDPLETVYLRAPPQPELPPLLCQLIISLLPRYTYSAAAARLVRRDKRAGPDPAALTAGFAVLLRQYPPAYLQARTLVVRSKPNQLH